ncbi:MAG: cysteine methyltransferase [Clostridiales bacterium]|nr:cysteine methyltransferase [Clostridiales bacterium]
MGFFEEVYSIVKKIPKGKVATYGQIAKLMGQPRKSKMVGWALHSNPTPGVIPCHRVVNRMGELSGSFAFGGADVQKQLLVEEGIKFSSQGIIDLQQYLWEPCDKQLVDININN